MDFFGGSCWLSSMLPWLPNKCQHPKNQCNLLLKHYGQKSKFQFTSRIYKPKWQLLYYFAAWYAHLIFITFLIGLLKAICVGLVDNFSPNFIFNQEERFLPLTFSCCMSSV
jgi:hypothetical protein